MDLVQQKKRLRQEMKEIMSFIPQKSDRSEMLLQILLDRQLFQKIKTISIFITLEDEVNTLPVVEYCWKNGITVTVPESQNVEGKEFVLRKWIKSDRLYETQYGIFHPKNTETYPLDGSDLIFVPGMAFTKDGVRLGRGKGFYDRMLSHYKGKKIGLCFREQIKENIPSGERDIKVDEVISC